MCDPTQTNVLFKIQAYRFLRQLGYPRFLPRTQDLMVQIAHLLSLDLENFPDRITTEITSDLYHDFLPHDVDRDFQFVSDEALPAEKKTLIPLTEDHDASTKF